MYEFDLEFRVYDNYEDPQYAFFAFVETYVATTLPPNLLVYLGLAATTASKVRIYASGTETLRTTITSGGSLRSGATSARWTDTSDGTDTSPGKRRPDVPL
ncbi:hypothetical protein EXIGLDRAFT_100762 [Exidia glandulosa HHB12029]|uniref:Uncharacterized protein n=1 Tax=Exidia glandulosa HHB12029 TaxID=1314781 RepID=A0A165NRZ3_EXIGL|nr:hypothetical protein EXIGLDRAFT_100762 [Exidia glandulosa HHB12029]